MPGPESFKSFSPPLWSWHGDRAWDDLESTFSQKVPESCRNSYPKERLGATVFVLSDKRSVGVRTSETAPPVGRGLIRDGFSKHEFVGTVWKVTDSYKYIPIVLTLAGTRHFAILHGTRGGGGVMRLPSRLATEWDRALLCSVTVSVTACFLSRDEVVDTRV